MTEKILSRACDREEVEPGEIVQVPVDLVFGQDTTMPLAVIEFRQSGAGRVFDPDKVAIVCDHFVPNATVQAAQQTKSLREFAAEQGIKHYFEAGRGANYGIEHALLPEEGLIRPGMIIVGADSHTTSYGALGAFASGFGSTDVAAAMALGEVWLRVPDTMLFVYQGELKPWVGAKDLILYTIGQIGVAGALYRTMELVGPVIESLTVNERLTMCNMGVEAGAKNAIVPLDQETDRFLRSAGVRETEAGSDLVRSSDPDAHYCSVTEIDVGRIEPQVACPSSPDNVRTLSDVSGTELDAAFIGSCTNGRIDDLRGAAAVLRGKHVSRKMRLIVIPATQRIYLQALREGLLEVFAQAGAVVSTPTCGPCFGGHMGLLAAGERVISTTNRNFVGRMGHPESEVFLSSPVIAAASAVVGRIAHPDEVVG
jgi:3-isopropylmalate/(R)-2-methylmalate dehydratase large subunit